MGIARATVAVVIVGYAVVAGSKNHFRWVDLVMGARIVGLENCIKLALTGLQLAEDFHLNAEHIVVVRLSFVRGEGVAFWNC